MSLQSKIYNAEVKSTKETFKALENVITGSSVSRNNIHIVSGQVRIVDYLLKLVWYFILVNLFPSRLKNGP